MTIDEEPPGTACSASSVVRTVKKRKLSDYAKTSATKLAPIKVEVKRGKNVEYIKLELVDIVYSYYCLMLITQVCWHQYIFNGDCNLL